MSNEQTPRRYTEDELWYARRVYHALEARAEHITDINSEVFIDRVCMYAFGRKVWPEMKKEILKEGRDWMDRQSKLKAPEEPKPDK